MKDLPPKTDSLSEPEREALKEAAKSGGCIENVDPWKAVLPSLKDRCFVKAVDDTRQWFKLTEAGSDAATIVATEDLLGDAN